MPEIRTSLHKYFDKFPDHRVNRHKKHLLSDIIVISIVAVICGAESWDSIEAFGKTKHQFLKTFLKLPNGIPSHDTINRVFSAIRPKLFETMFAQWAGSLKNEAITREVISIDGKCIKGSKDSFHHQSPIHMVSAWASENKLVLGQLKVDGKSNEITAIPLLLDLLDIEGSIITIDAIGTQVKIAQKIVQSGADYILAVKGNQEELLEQVEARFNNQQAASSNQTVEKGHGRIETRKCDTITNLEFLDCRERWEELNTIIRITSERDLGKKQETETRYYISSATGDAASFNRYIRQHWGVENNVHWMLDMTFNEDRQRKRTKNSAQNFSFVRKIALNLLKQDKSKGSSVTKRLKAGWDDSFLLQLLKI